MDQQTEIVKDDMATNSRSAFAPIVVSEAEANRWSEQSTLGFSVAKLVAKYSPRGKGWFPRKLGSHFGKYMKLIIRTANNAKLAIDPLNLDVYTTIVLNGGSWDPHVLSICQAVTHPGDIFLDIGANAGVISIEMSKIFGDKVSVIAFEPQASLAQCIAISAKLNGFNNMRVYELMLGSKEGFVDLFIPSHSIHASTISREAGAKRKMCLMTTLDGLVEKGILLPPHTIKVDVEGGEMDVFRGAANTIRAHEPYIVFESDKNMHRFGYRREDLFSYLNSLAKYRFFYIGIEMLYPVKDSINDMYFSDVLAVPPRAEGLSLISSAVG